jgi:Flp pilus assembly protein CpaB
VRLVRQATAAALVCLALVLALRPPPAIEPRAPTVRVVTAAADLPAGTVLTTGDLVTVALPAAVAPGGSAPTADELTGRVLAAPVRAGEVVTDVRVVGPGLWAQTPMGQVATPVRLADLAVAGLLRAGDRVDVLAAAGSPGGGTPTVTVVAEGALVLSGPAAGSGSAPVGGTDSGLLVLAVPPDTAQRLAAAGAGGTLTVTLGRP